MDLLKRCSILLTILAAANANAVEPPRQAVATLLNRNPLDNRDITGTVVFTETSNGTQITGTIVGLPAGKYGFHVHEMGTIVTCDAAGGHFNPDGTNHGGIDHEVRHVGDLGNVEFEGAILGVSNINIVDTVLTLRGRNNIVGRTLVLHAEEDDLGLGGNEGSLTTGNAGARVACGVIGIAAPLDPWNSAATSSPSILVFIASAIFVYVRA
ncbi:superoxide dismutase [Cu-Zn]-like [Anticarsia gemmatalis]|uniref:superoxide dismutase [Cu-Zn]-like n=1 Tax=Anticarsia gemmatalis TaxID=129554 RepID=UPI003F767BC8